MHQSSIDKMQSFKDTYLKDRESQALKILDLGSQNIGGSYRSIFNEANWSYCGVDLELGQNVDLVIKNAYKWDEISSESVDVLISGQTLEHIEYFWITILEIARVLKPGGICCLIAPSSGYEHRYPVDCWRFYPDGLVALASFAKLEVLEAFTQWEDREYTDGSNIWHDSVLIAGKSNTHDTFNDKSGELLEDRLTEFDRRHSEIATDEVYLRHQLKLSQANLARSQDRLNEVTVELVRLQAQMQNVQETLEKSLFWKLRTQWFKLKRAIGLI